MTEFEEVLQECLRDLEQGTSTVDDCLRRHPNYAQELAPILFASARLERAGEMRVSEAFKERVRAKLVQEMRPHPRKRARLGLPFLRLAVSFAVVLLALLATGTAYAQRALPGETLYGWKLASENAWRAVSVDPVGTELVIAERRAEELIAVQADPALRAQALETYLETVARLRSQAGTEDEIRIAPALDSQIEKLKKLGILLSQSDPSTLPSDEPIPPTAAPMPQTPHVDPTAVPQMTPTLNPPPQILPTVEIPPELAPTIHIPPPIR